MPTGTSPFVTASDLADYAYCPRSYWYRSHPPPEGPTPAAVRSARAGARAHAHQLTAERRRYEHGPAYWALVAVGVLFLVGGLSWLL